MSSEGYKAAPELTQELQAVGACGWGACSYESYKAAPPHTPSAQAVGATGQSREHSSEAVGAKRPEPELQAVLAPGYKALPAGQAVPTTATRASASLPIRAYRATRYACACGYACAYRALRSLLRRAPYAHRIRASRVLRAYARFLAARPSASNRAYLESIASYRFDGNERIARSSAGDAGSFRILPASPYLLRVVARIRSRGRNDLRRARLARSLDRMRVLLAEVAKRIVSLLRGQNPSATLRTCGPLVRLAKIRTNDLARDAEFISDLLRAIRFRCHVSSFLTMRAKRINVRHVRVIRFAGHARIIQTAVIRARVAGRYAHRFTYILHMQIRCIVCSISYHIAQARTNGTRHCANTHNPPLPPPRLGDRAKGVAVARERSGLAARVFQLKGVPTYV